VRLDERMVEVYSVWSPDCVTWFLGATGALIARHLLDRPPLDPNVSGDLCESATAVHAPSYVVRTDPLTGGLLNEVYYSASFVDGFSRGLELITAADTAALLTGAGSGGSEVVARFPATEEVFPPIQISTVGADLLATYVVAPTAQVSGIGILLAEEARSWRKLVVPLFGPSGEPGTFDRRAIVSAALSVQGAEYWVHYGARSGEPDTPGGVIQVGAARLRVRSSTTGVSR